MPDLTPPAVERVVATFPIEELGSDLSATGAAIETSVTADAATECGVPLLGRIPLNGAIRAQTDAGTPPLIADPESAVSRRYREIARRAAAALAQRPKDQKHKFPKIVVEERK